MYLETRATCYDSYTGRRYRCNSTWNSWARWVVFAIIVIGAFILFFMFACISARRRRKRNLSPYRGTGWAVPGHAPAQYNPQYNPNYQNQQQGYNQPPPPQYAPNGTSQPGYFGGQQQNVELQQPGNVYRGGENVYEPPAGPPPGKA